MTPVIEGAPIIVRVIQSIRHRVGTDCCWLFLIVIEKKCTPAHCGVPDYFEC